MVLTNPSNVDAYASLNPHFPAAFAALREMAAGNCPTGRYPVLEDTVFINVLEYDTHPAQGALMEVHRSYIDVMWVVSGQEQIGICPVEEMAVTKAYDPAGDAALGTLADPLPGGCPCTGSGCPGNKPCPEAHCKSPGRLRKEQEKWKTTM